MSEFELGLGLAWRLVTQNAQGSQQCRKCGQQHARYARTTPGGQVDGILVGDDWNDNREVVIAETVPISSDEPDSSRSCPLGRHFQFFSG